MAVLSLASWSWQPGILLGIAAIVSAYVIGLRRFRPETLWQENVVTRREIGFFSAGVLALFIGLVSPIDYYSASNFSVHMVQHLFLIYVAAPCFLLGTPAWLIRPVLQIPYAKPFLRFSTSFIPSTLIFNGILILWHLPTMWDFALVDPQVHALEHLMFLIAGLVVWWPIYGPLPEVPRLSYPAQMLYLLVQSLVPAIIGAFMTFSGVVIYPVYLETPKLWGLTPLADQQIAGLIMKFVGTLLLWGIVTVRFFQWFNHEEHEDEKAIDDGARR
jgi:putative membrane protein